MNKFLRNSRGFTLLELMIVAGIFMLVLIPVLSVFTSSHESYLVQDDISATQQNIRAALMYLRKDIRMAGSGLGDVFMMFDIYDADEDGDFGETIRVFGITAGNGQGPNSDETDELIVRYVNMDNLLCEQGGAAAPFCTDLPRLYLLGIDDGDVTFDVKEDLTIAPFNRWGSACNCGGNSWTLPPAIIKSPDGKLNHLIIIDSLDTSDDPDEVSKAEDVQFGFDGDTYSVENRFVTDNMPEDRTFVGGTLSFFNIEAYQQVRYFLDDRDGDGVSDTLMRQVNDNDPMPLADGIEDLQFDYLGDFNEDGSMEVSGAPEWYNLNYNFGADGNFAIEEEQQAVRMVRIRILARTSKEWRELGKTDSPDLDDQDSTGTRNDHFRRRVIEQDVQVRNLSL